MKSSALIIFISIVLLTYGSINGHILWRGLQSFSASRMARLIFVVVFLSFVLAFPLGRIINGGFRHHLSEKLTAFGSYHLALMIYLLLLLLLKDILRGLAHTFRLPLARAGFLSVRNQVSFLVIIAIAMVIVFIGHLNATSPRLKILELKIDKQVPVRSELKAVLISDIHLGIINRSNRLESLVRRINELEAEVVFFAGHIVDEAVSLEEEEKMVGLMKKIQAPLGLYACPGNHEYYGGFAKNISYLEKAGVRVLLDEAAKVNESFFIIGRKDWTALRYGEKRLSLKEIMEKHSVDLSWPVIVLDHQPLNLSEAEQAGVDLQLSGHTHAGQLFPLNLINKMVYEKNWGYVKKGKTHIYVSSGSGTWGPAVRTGSRSKIVLLRMKFAD